MADLHVSGGLAAAAAGPPLGETGSWKVHLLDVSNPRAPERLSSVGASGPCHIAGSVLLATSGSVLCVFDITNPRAPALLFCFS